MKVILEWSGEKDELLKEGNGMSLADNIIYAMEQDALVCHNGVNIKVEKNEKPYWAKYYEAKKAEPTNVSTSEPITARELVELGYNMAYIDNGDKMVSAGYIDEDGAIQTYELTEEELDKTQVIATETDYDEDGYPIIFARVVGKGGE